MPDTEKIYKGDLLDVTVVPEVNATTSASQQKEPLLVKVGDEDGWGTLPQVGKLPMAGLTLSQAGEVIKNAYKDVYLAPTVTVKMNQQATNQVFVCGAVEKPEKGKIECQRVPRWGCTVARAVQQAGGVREKDGSSFAYVFRRLSPLSPPGPERADPLPHDADATALKSRLSELAGYQGFVLYMKDERHRKFAAEAYLDDGSVVHVLPRTLLPVSVTENVQKPGNFEFPFDHNPTLMEAIAAQGGSTGPMANEVTIIRRTNGEPITIKAGIWDAQNKPNENILLSPGDIVVVRHTPLTILWLLSQRVAFSLGGSFPVF